MNKYSMALLSVCLSFTNISFAASGGEAFQLISESEYQHQIGFKRPPVLTRGFTIAPKGSPKINIKKPTISGVVASPTNIEISFEADKGAKIDVESLEVLYGWLALDITDRIKEHAKLSAKGLVASNVSLPEGDHTITIVIKDSKGRETEKELSFSIAN